MPYTNPQRDALIAAMIDAFDVPALIRAMRTHLGVRLFDWIPNGAKRDVVENLIGWIEGRGWERALVRMVAEERSGNSFVAAFLTAHTEFPALLRTEQRDDLREGLLAVVKTVGDLRLLLAPPLPGLPPNFLDGAGDASSAEDYLGFLIRWADYFDLVASLVGRALERHPTDGVLASKAMRFAAVRVPVAGARPGGDDLIWRRSNPAREELIERLMNLSIAPSLFKPLYLTVISTLARGSGRDKAETIPQMIDVLWNAKGRADAATAPASVVEFALRVRKVFGPAADNLDSWLDCVKFVSPSHRAEAQRHLDEEQKALYLVVEIIESKSGTRTGQIEKFRALLLDYDHVRPVEPWTPVEQDVTCWQQLEAEIRPLLDQAREIADQRDATLTIEFSTNVFDIDPHRIVLAGEPDRLGEKHPVVLRLRSPRSRDARQPWLARANEIREGRFKNLVHRVTVANPSLQSCRVLFIGHALPAGSHPAHPQPLTPEWQLLRRSVNAGVPFIFWPLRAAANGDCDEYERALTEWVDDSRPVDRIPSHVRDERVTSSSAADVNMFWDDPLPTWQLREIRTS